MIVGSRRPAGQCLRPAALGALAPYSSRAASRAITDDSWPVGAPAALGGPRGGWELPGMLDSSEAALRHTGARRSGGAFLMVALQAAIPGGGTARFAIALVLTVMPPMQEHIDVLCPVGATASSFG